MSQPPIHRQLRQQEEAEEEPGGQKTKMQAVGVMVRGALGQQGSRQRSAAAGRWRQQRQHGSWPTPAWALACVSAASRSLMLSLRISSACISSNTKQRQAMDGCVLQRRGRRGSS